MKQNSFQEHVAFGKTITFNPDFTIVLWWAGSAQIILLLQVLKISPKESFSSEQFFHKENEESFDATVEQYQQCFLIIID
jgi:hypothetical protein